MTACVFCANTKGEQIFWRSIDGLFTARWDIHPVTPGHALVVPTRHVQHFAELTSAELLSLPFAVKEVKAYLRQVNMQEVYETMSSQASQKMRGYLTSALTLLAKVGNRPPDAFNDGLNDGAAAGQTVPHLHWHIMPRWEGDAQSSRGGIRHMFAGKGDYHA